MRTEFQAGRKADFAFFAEGMEGCKCLQQNLIRSAKADDILKEYRSINCKTCTRHFGYQQRLNGDIYFCSSPCLAVSETDTLKSNGIHICTSLRNEPRKTAKAGESSETGQSSGFPGKGLSEEDREVAEFMKVKQVSTTINSVGGVNISNNSRTDSRTSGRGRSSGHTFLSTSAGTESSDKIEEWRRNVEEKLESTLEGEDIPASTESINSMESEGHPLRGNKDMIAAARKKSTSPPARSVAKVSALVRITKPGTNGNDVEALVNAKMSKDKSSPDQDSVESNKSKRWAIGNLKLSSSFVNKTGCYIAYVWSPVRFTLNAAVDASKQDELCTSMAKYCAEAPKLDRLPSVGEIVFAPYNGDFYRALVQQVLSEKKIVRVKFIDYGDSNCVKLSNCREPSDEIMEMHPIYGIDFECLVKNDCPIDAKLPEKLTAMIQERVYIEGKVSSSNDFKWKGSLYTDENLSNKFNDHVDNWISSLGRATEQEQEPPTEITSNRTSPEVKREVSVTRDKSEQCLTRSNPFSGSVLILGCKRMLRDATISPNLCKYGAHVRVNYMWNYKTLTISAVDDDKHFDTLDTLIKNHVKTDSGLKRAVEVDEIIIAPYQGSFYRGVVTSLDGSNAHVRFLDYGDKTVVPVSELVELSPEIDKLPIYGIIMKMDGVPDELPTLDIENMDVAMSAESQIEVLERSDETGVWTGYLWIASDRNWNEMILSALKSNA
ncbi:unnamed protein product [Allacma fusca]|uniref:Tudor domain-containing protein n=1 Tax=Allacma fusca TaxID=39272 RepID=A0A8J2KCY9_9HEXA|nr:unnamed protein product [Allacma fusca]